MNHNTIWEIIKHIRYEDIGQVCIVNRQFLEVCRTDQAQTHFRTLHRVYLIQKFLKDVNDSHASLSSLHYDSLHSSYSHKIGDTFPIWQQVGFNLIASYPHLEESILQKVVSRGKYNKWNPEILQFISEVDSEFLLQHYHLFPRYLERLQTLKETDARFTQAFLEINKAQKKEERKARIKKRQLKIKKRRSRSS